MDILVLRCNVVVQSINIHIYFALSRNKYWCRTKYVIHFCQDFIVSRHYFFNQLLKSCKAASYPSNEFLSIVG